MKFGTGDLVIYGKTGICKIEEIADRTFYEEAREYYILKPVNNDKSTIYAPVDSESTDNRMRRVLSVDETHDLIKGMPDEPSIWINNESQRKERFKQIISGGNRRELVQLIKTLYLHRQNQKAAGKKLHAADEQYFKEAEDLLYNEISVVLNIQRSQIIPFIFQQVEDGPNVKTS